MSLHVASSAFPDHGTIPEKYSCDGQNVSPPLEWRGAPDRTQSFAIICDDPDAPRAPFTHWLLYNIPPTTGALSEGDAFTGTAGLNGFGKSGYGGPCPPHNDPAHHYAFHVYALDVPSLGNPGLAKPDLVKAMERHVIDEGELIGEYRRWPK